MASRDQLQSELEDILGSPNVYFQPPESKKILYPCIIYRFDAIASKKAENYLYKTDNRYTIIYITKKVPLSTDIPKKILKRFPMCQYGQHYVSDNLHHDIFTLYY